MKKYFILMSFILVLLTANTVFADSNYYYQNQQPQHNNQYIQQTLLYPNNNTLQGNVIMVPAGESVNAMLTVPLSSANTITGQTVSLVLRENFSYGNTIIAPAGSTIYGTVIEAKKAKRAGVNGKLSVRFNQIYTPYGTQIPISAVIQTNDSSGVLIGGTKIDSIKDYTKDIAVGSASGALSGVVFGALAGGEVGKGAALGTAVGAGLGLAKSVWDKGKDVEIPANAIIGISFTQPITVNAFDYQN